MSNVITAREFEDMLTASMTNDLGLRVPPHTIVEHDVNIDGQNINLTKKGTDGKGYQSIYLDEVAFIGMVTIRNYNRLSLRFQNTHFLDGLWIENSSGLFIGISGCQCKSINLWCGGARGHSFEVVSLCQVKSTAIDLSGLNLKKHLTLEHVEAKGGLGLTHPSTGDTLRTPRVVTDNLVWALQFRMAGIPVITSTSNIMKMLAADPQLLGKIN